MYIFHLLIELQLNYKLGHVRRVRCTSCTTLEPLDRSFVVENHSTVQNLKKVKAKMNGLLPERLKKYRQVI